jgi:hypothetical protein
MSKRKKYPLAPGWLKLTTPEFELAYSCPDCGRRVRVVSARKLIAGKEDAKITVSCGCSGSFLYQPSKEERFAILRRYHIRLN